MIAYLDSSVLAKAYLHDEEGHEEARALIADPEISTVTGSWAWIEVSGALVRATRGGRVDLPSLLRSLDNDLDLNGRVTVLSVPQAEVEARAMALAREHGSRAMDAWHLAAAALVLPRLAEAREARGFATRDKQQAEVAATMGFEVI